MARGQIAKAEITKKILSSFEGAFSYNDGKEIRIPIEENGELIQVKVTLTAAKENVNPGDDNAIPGVNTITSNEDIDFSQKTVTASKETTITKPTEEEKKNVNDLLRALGL